MHRHPANIALYDNPTFGQRAADAVARNFGSWRFIIVQTAFVVMWMAYNVATAVALIRLGHSWRLATFDPYPFILLNLVFSTQAAYAAPIILLSQNRQSEHDRRSAEHAYAEVSAIKNGQAEIKAMLTEILRRLDG